MEWSNLWQLLAGLGIFLFGMSQLEEALKELAGRTFKLFLKKHTDNPLNAILSGTVVTAVLQSSSVVTLMALGFVGAGIIQMRNALAVVFGSNLGTTLDSWVVAALGFKFNIESLSFPIISIAGIGLIAFTGRKKLYQASKFSMGFGLLFLGLSFMKESIESLIQGFDFSPYLQLNRLSFILIGFIITAIIQSSSATMVITLSALNTGVLSFEAAVSVIIGSELGTAIKTVLGSINGIVAKRRVALGNLIFNIVITFLAYLLTGTLISLITSITGDREPLIGLVMFQTFINLIGILIFFPFLKRFGDFLEKRFSRKERSATYFIQDINPVPEAALEVLDKEVLLFMHRVINLNMETFQIKNIIYRINNDLIRIIEKENDHLSNYNDKYDEVKRAEGEILSFYMKMNEEKIEKIDFTLLNKLISSVRNAMYAAKCIKDIRQDIKDLRESAADTKYEQYKSIHHQLQDFYLKLTEIFGIKDQSFRFEELVKLIVKIDHDYEVRTKNIYNQSANNALNEYDISTLLNVNREVYSSCKSIILSLKEYLLDAIHAENFDNMPSSLI